MDIVNVIVNIYKNLHNSNSIIDRLFSPIRFSLRKFGNLLIPYLLMHDNRSRKREVVPIIVSLTSFPLRIEKVWIVIKSFLRQTKCPEKIILWLSKEQFPDDLIDIPDNLKKLLSDIFEIRFVDEDIKSHKKYFYVSKEYPDKLIFLADDDIIYPKDILERTYLEHFRNPNAVICNYAYRIGYVNGEISTYKSWSRLYSYSKGYDLFFGSGGGTLIQPSKMYKDFLNKELAIELSPIADDVWINAMAKLSHLPIVMLQNGLIYPILVEKDATLAEKNVFNNQNDVQINNIVEYYQNIICKNPFLIYQ